MPRSEKRESSKADADEDRKEDDISQSLKEDILKSLQGDEAQLDSKPESVALAEEEENAVEEDAEADDQYGLPRDKSRVDDNQKNGNDAESQQDDDEQDLQAEGGASEVQSRASDDQKNDDAISGVDDNDADLGEGQEEPKDIYEQEAEAILARQNRPFKVIPHPMHTKVKEVDELVEYLEKLVDEERYLDYICDDVMGLNSNVYRKKIKGFHLAFNVRDKLSEELSGYKYQPTGTAEEIRLKALNLRNNRMQ